MSEPGYRAMHISELESVPVGDSLVWRPVRRTFGIEAFGVNAYTAQSPGDEIVEEHDEKGSGAGGHQELYIVVSGHVTFTVGGEEIDAPAGTLVFLRDPAVRRGAHAKEPGSTVLAVGGEPGVPYQVSPWEYFFAAIPYTKAGEWERAADTVAEGLERYPENPSILYNLGCFEAQAGRREDALEHVRRALELDPRVREWAKDDPDLDSIRGELDL